MHKDIERFLITPGNGDYFIGEMLASIPTFRLAQKDEMRFLVLMIHERVCEPCLLSRVVSGRRPVRSGNQWS